MYPLKNIKILDLTNLLPGPFATMILSGLGAEVIKVERPGSGDFAREISPELFTVMNKGKQSVELDLKNDNDKEILTKFIKQSDVLIESFRPGVIDRLGFGKDNVKKMNANLIYCSISGYGQTGPYRNIPGHDINYLATAGILSISGNPKEKPEENLGIQVADLTSSLYAVISILAALQQRNQSEVGSYIDLSMTDAALSLMIPRVAEYYGRNQPDKQTFMSRSAYGIYATKDNRYLSLGCVEEHFWEKLCHLLGLEELITNKRFNSWIKRMEHADYIDRKIKQIILEKNLDEWLTLFNKEDIPCSAVNRIEDLRNNEHLKARNMIVEQNDKFTINLPFHFEGMNIHNSEESPKLGEHNELKYKM